MGQRDESSSEREELGKNWTSDRRTNPGTLHESMAGEILTFFSLFVSLLAGVKGMAISFLPMLVLQVCNNTKNY